jgi:hypothetical protein
VFQNSEIKVDELAELFENAYFALQMIVSLIVGKPNVNALQNKPVRWQQKSFSHLKKLCKRGRIIVNRELRWLVPKGQSMTIAIRGTDISVTSSTDS